MHGPTPTRYNKQPSHRRRSRNGPRISRTVSHLARVGSTVHLIGSSVAAPTRGCPTMAASRAQIPSPALVAVQRILETEEMCGGTRLIQPRPLRKDAPRVAYAAVPVPVTVCSPAPTAPESRREHQHRPPARCRSGSLPQDHRFPCETSATQGQPRRRAWPSPP